MKIMIIPRYKKNDLLDYIKRILSQEPGKITNILQQLGYDITTETVDDIIINRRLLKFEVTHSFKYRNIRRFQEIENLIKNS